MAGTAIPPLQSRPLAAELPNAVLMRSLTRGRPKPAAAGSSPIGVPTGAEIHSRPVKRGIAIDAVRRPSVGAGIGVQPIPVVVPLRDVASLDIGIKRLGKRRCCGD